MRSNPTSVPLAVVVWLLWPVLSIVPSAWARAEIGFNEDIRPILSDRCFFCHGPDSAKREADLRLDSREDAINSGAIQPGSPEKSALLDRILSTDPELQMPPPHSKLPRLTDAEVSTLRQWISEGAPYEKHWSFEPLDYKTFGPDRNPHPIDAPVRQQLAKRHIQPQPSADRATLARRASFDITGLPPTEADWSSFMNDPSPDAWERYLDRLLESPHYGERMAVDWLDVARYSDSFGFQVDRERMMWPWRDWVVRSLNANKPFDEFIVEQLAGDLLPNPTKEQILATAFNRLHQQESEGGSVEEEYRVEYVADRVQTYATAFLGLTFECARCHDHKYDPITQREYYQLFSIFQNIDEAGLYSYFTPSPPTPTLTLTDENTDRALQELATKREDVESVHRTVLRSDRERTREWYDAKPSNERLANEGTRTPVLRLEFDTMTDKKLVNDAPGGAPNATLEGDNQLVDGRSGKAVQFTGDDPVKTNVGNFKRHEPFSVSLWLQTPDIKERAVVFHRSRAWTDAASRGYELLMEDGKLKWSLIHFWPGNAISIRTTEQVPVKEWTHVAVTYDGSSRADGLKIYVNGKVAPTETLKDKLTKEITGGGYDSIDLGERFRDKGFRGGLVDSFQVFPFQLSPLESLRLFSEEQASNLIEQSYSELSKENQSILEDHFVLAKSTESDQSRKLVQEARRLLFEKQDSLTEIMVMRELPAPKPAYILTRGEYNQPAAPVEPGTPAALSPFSEAWPKNRLGLARWTVARDNPLTARVVVNRVWQSIFGRGLVKTPEDFGSQGARPTYPQILDALAVRFVESGWDMKQLIKTILMSETYRQRSVSDASNMEEDPENDLLARGPRFRLPAEMIRDNALAIAGLLDLKMGGEPVNPYELTESFKPVAPSGGNGVYRRSLYTQWRRTGPPPAMIAFDAPRRAVCVAKRERTDSPLQALVLLNGVQYVEAARALATRILTSQPTSDNAPLQITDKMISQVFEQTIYRKPDAKEIEIASTLLTEQERHFEEHPDAAKEFLQIGRYPRNESLPVHKLAAFTVLCQALLNHDACVLKR